MSTNLISIFVDADACPVKEEVERVADRHKIKTYIVSNGGIRPSQNPLLNLVVVSKESDAADIWISENMSENDIVWGVGRGSSVASYVLYLIGVHRIDSIKYNLDWREFLR